MNEPLGLIMEQWNHIMGSWKGSKKSSKRIEMLRNSFDLLVLVTCGFDYDLYTITRYLQQWPLKEAIQRCSVAITGCHWSNYSADPVGPPLWKIRSFRDDVGDSECNGEWTIVRYL